MCLGVHLYVCLLCACVCVCVRACTDGHIVFRVCSCNGIHSYNFATKIFESIQWKRTTAKHIFAAWKTTWFASTITPFTLSRSDDDVLQYGNLFTKILFHIFFVCDVDEWIRRTVVWHGAIDVHFTTRTFAFMFCASSIWVGCTSHSTLDWNEKRRFDWGEKKNRST